MARIGDRITSLNGLMSRADWICVGSRRTIGRPFHYTGRVSSSLAGHTGPVFLPSVCRPTHNDDDAWLWRLPSDAEYLHNAVSRYLSHVIRRFSAGWLGKVKISRHWIRSRYVLMTAEQVHCLTPRVQPRNDGGSTRISGLYAAIFPVGSEPELLRWLRCSYGWNMSMKQYTRFSRSWAVSAIYSL